MSLVVWKIDPLPDFLSDHTLTGDCAADRLREYASRWVQLAGSVWEWRDQATLALRYVSQGGRTSIYLLAKSRRDEDTARLEAQIGVVLRAHRLMEGGCGTVISSEEFERETHLSNPAIVELRQLAARHLWTPQNTKAARFAKRAVMQQVQQSAPLELERPGVVFPWWGPGGPFLLPMESLISQKVACSLTIYLAPTELAPMEREWLSVMSQLAQSQAEQSLQMVGTSAPVSEVDPVAKLVGRLYMANLRRLSATPFQVVVHCAAADSQLDASLSLAGAVQSLVHEPAFERPQQEDDRLPSGAEVHIAALPEAAATIADQYANLHFAPWSATAPLARLPTLADAQGATTVFRLPVSVRGGVPGIRVRQLAPNFHPGPRMTECAPSDPPSICLGDYLSGGKAFVPLADLTKHVLVTGFTGSGKTVTVLQLLHQIWVDHQVPFLVLESAKQEYRGLAGVDSLGNDLRIYTLGNETCSPLRLNPFELPPGVRVEAHMSKLQTCFEAAIPPVGPTSSVIHGALLKVYERFGWLLTDLGPSDEGSHRQFPMLSDFVAAIEEVIDERRYAGEVRDNLRAAIVGRFEPLLTGSKGKLFNTRRSSPSLDALFNKPTILEMNDLSIDDKALVVMFVLTLLREHRERNKAFAGELKHVTLVEEAHNVLEDVGSTAGGDGGAADTRYKAVQAFCGLLTEIRALGEGLIIADQSPEKLARDAMRNTNLQIAHQLRDAHDRNAIANAMTMEEEQRDYLGKLQPGHAAVFRTGLEKATFLKVPKYYPTGEDIAHQPPREASEWPAWRAQFRGYGFDSSLTDQAVRERMEQRDTGLRQVARVAYPFAACAHCRSQCTHRDRVFAAFDSSEEAQAQAGAWLERVQERMAAEDGDLPSIFAQTASFATFGLNHFGWPASVDLAWCFLLHAHDVGRRKTADGVVIDAAWRPAFDEAFAQP